jgi:hypothetical protein
MEPGQGEWHVAVVIVCYQIFNTVREDIVALSWSKESVSKVLDISSSRFYVCITTSYE